MDSDAILTFPFRKASWIKRVAETHGIFNMAEDTLRRSCENGENSGLSAGTGKLCIFGHLGLVFIWSCFVSCLLLLLYYVICAPVLTEGTENSYLFDLAGNNVKWKTISLTHVEYPEGNPGSVITILGF